MVGTYRQLAIAPTRCLCGTSVLRCGSLGPTMQLSSMEQRRRFALLIAGLAFLALLSASALWGVASGRLFPARFVPVAEAALGWGARQRAVARDGFAPPGCTKAQPCLAIVIDDLGRDPAPLERLLALPLALTFSLLPHGAATRDATRQIARQGRESWLHLPMAPVDPQQLSDEAVVLSSVDAVPEVLVDALRRVGPVCGVNNHMGSAFSQQAASVAALMGQLRARGLAFLDSRTSPNSLFCSVAARKGVPCRRRDVFLDDRGDTATVDYRLREAVQLARDRGWAIVIGHPFVRTIEALSRFSPKKYGVVVRRLSTFFGSCP